MKKLQASLTALSLFLLAVGCRKNEDDQILTQQQITNIQSDSLTTKLETTSGTSVTKVVQVNIFGGSNAYTDATWNNWNSASSLSAAAFKYTDGSASAITAAFNQQGGVSDNSTSLLSTMAPKEVVRYASYSTSNRTLTISGLDNAKTYNLEFYASRAGTSNNTTRFTIGTTNVDVKTDNNLANKASFSGITPSGGKIVVTVAKLNTYNYLNGFSISEVGGVAAATPPVEQLPAPTTTTTTGKVYTLGATSGTEIYIPDASARGWKGGDTVRIKAGTYSLIVLGKFKGDASNPIVFINYGGQVKVNQIRIDNDAAYFKLLGNGSSAYTYGISINSTFNAGVAIAIAHDFEISNIEVTGTEVGFYIKKNPTLSIPLSIYPNYTLSNIYIHHNYIHDVHGEGMYIGDTYPSADPYNGNLIPIRMDHVEIAYNTVDGTDWDGIQLSNARSGAKIHHNSVNNFGRINMGSQQSGIILGGNTTGDIYENTVKTGTGNGIEVFGYGLCKVYNNTVENAGYDGTTSGQESIFCNDPINLVETNPKQQIQMYNNIIKNPKPKGAIRVGAYNANSLASSVTNNTVYLANAASNWLTFYVVSNAPGSTITGNTVIR
ncbi:MAG TPA: hypothetical protein VHK91_14140 [Flavisolibacter sp.]|jgi:hypothetical protein|nr:hypothetical protein [Flavisolibacter sp.]